MPSWHWSKSIDIVQYPSTSTLVYDTSQWHWPSSLLPLKFLQGYQVYQLTQVYWHWTQVDAIVLIQVQCLGSISSSSSIPSLVQYDEGSWFTAWSKSPKFSQSSQEVTQHVALFHVLFRREFRRRRFISQARSETIPSLVYDEGDCISRGFPKVYSVVRYDEGS
jgi:hypothetical protein